MATFTTFFFSGTGNTWWTAREFTRLAQEMGHRAVAYSIEQENTQDQTLLTKAVEESDLVGFAYPIYGASMPSIMERFIENLANVVPPKGEHHPVQTYNICTVGYVNAYGPFAAGRFFKSLGFSLIGFVNIRLTNNISAPEMRTKIADAEQLERRKTKALPKLRTLIHKLAHGEKYIRGIGPYVLPGIIIRRTLGRKIRECHKILSIDINKCTRCMLCVNSCPTQSIHYDTTFTIEETCTACMRCYNLCPTGSILHQGHFADSQIYTRYRGPEKEWLHVVRGS
jgi:ferredoxin